MNFLLLDHESMGLDLALRAQSAGHSVILANGYDGDRTPARSGDGLVPKTLKWQDKMKWADLILMTGNGRWLSEIDSYHQKGYPIFGPNKLSADLELDRCYGQHVLSSCGVETLPFTNFDDYDEAERFVLKTLKRYVSKPHGDKKKDLSYVSKNPADMVFMLRRWKRTRPAQEGFFLQEFQAGIEMAVGGWFGPSGWVGPWCESFECKKLMPGDLGVNTGEMGCYDEATEVLTHTGWKFWKDVTQEDSLATLQAGHLVFEQPSVVVSYEVEGELLHWSNQTLDIMVTNCHNMYVNKQASARKKENAFEFIAAKDCTQAQYQLKRTAEWRGKFAEDLAVVKLYAMYLSDGSTNKNQFSLYPQCAWKAAKFSAVRDELPYDFKEYSPGVFTCYHPTQTALFQEFGGSPDRYIPQWIKELDKEGINTFLDYYFDVNTQKNGFRVFYTSSKQMADDLQELLLKVGRLGVIKKRPPREANTAPDGHIIKSDRPQYEIIERVKKLDSWLDKRDRKLVPYKGKVYCATVSSHILFVRRNGKPVWCGNTPVKYVRESQLAERVLKPCESVLHALNYVGYVDVNCIIDKRGCAWPLEWTARLGWPLTHAQVALHMGDPINWMAALLEGKDSLSVSYNHCVCVVIAIPDFPFSRLTSKEVEGIPIYGVTKENRDVLHPCNLMKGNAPAMKGERVVDTDLFVTSDDYPLVVSGTGSTVSRAKSAAYEVVEELEIPNSPMWRNDISDRLEKELPELQKHGFATGWRF